MFPHSRIWHFLLLVVIFLLVTVALGRPAVQSTPAPSPGPEPRVLVQTTIPPPPVPDSPPAENPNTRMKVLLLLHVVATVFGLRAGMKVFYENTMWSGFLAIVAIDALAVGAMMLLGPMTEGFTAMLGPQVAVTGLIMMVTLHHFGFTKERFTVIPAVLLAKAFGFFAEVALRMLFLDALVRFATSRGL